MREGEFSPRSVMAECKLPIRFCASFADPVVSTPGHELPVAF